MQFREMVSTHTDVQGCPADKLMRCIEDCYSCARCFTACADPCLAEPMADQMRQRILVNLDCADICAATGTTASRRPGSILEALRAAILPRAIACQGCGQECEPHVGEHAHCCIRVDNCNRCADACKAALAEV